MVPASLISDTLKTSPSVTFTVMYMSSFSGAMATCIDSNRILAAAEILVGEVLLHLVEHRPVEGLSGRQADVSQTLLQILGLDVLVALEFELGDRGTFDHDDQQRVAVAAQFHVPEKSRGIERAHGLADSLAVEMISDVHRQIVEHRAFRDSLQPLHTNVADSEGFLRSLRLRLDGTPQRLDGESHQAEQP